MVGANDNIYGKAGFQYRWLYSSPNNLEIQEILEGFQTNVGPFSLTILPDQTFPFLLVKKATFLIPWIITRNQVNQGIIRLKTQEMVVGGIIILDSGNSILYWALRFKGRFLFG